MGLNIIVCIKAVAEGTWGAKNTDKNFTLNLFDRPAIEMAMELTKKYDGTVTLVSMGPESACSALYEAMSMGPQKAVLLSDPLFRESDTYATAKVLSAAIKKLAPFDLLFFGTRSSDSDTGHVGPQTSQMLSIPYISNVHEMVDLGMDKATVERRADGFVERFQITGPGAMGVVHDGTEYGYTGLYEIENTFDGKSIQRWDHSDLGLEPHEIGLPGSPTKIVALNPHKSKKQCRFITGDVAQAAETLAQTLSQAGLVD
ncbi:electron transfer flavoprotein subunit beta/FixA family protein [Desulfocicer vacuolatum]|nr:electron transfer flavoprotein subunit beta/FixA family protein [Desulfocicer vacuolatum]